MFRELFWASGICATVQLATNFASNPMNLRNQATKAFSVNHVLSGFTGAVLEFLKQPAVRHTSASRATILSSWKTLETVFVENI